MTTRSFLILNTTLIKKKSQQKTVERTAYIQGYSDYENDYC